MFYYSQWIEGEQLNLFNTNCLNNFWLALFFGKILRNLIEKYNISDPDPT